MASFLTSLASTILPLGITCLFLFFVTSALGGFVVPLANFALNLSINPHGIGLIGQVIIWSQSCALIIVIFVRIGKGVWENVFQKAANQDTGSLTQWFVKTILAICCVILMPTICDLIIQFGAKAFSDVQTLVNQNGAVNLTYDVPLEEFWSNMAQQPVETLAIWFVSGFFVLFEIYFIAKVALDILKRQIIMYVVSIAATWVSIKSATDSSDDVLDVAVSLFGLVIIQIVEFVLFALAIGALNTAGGLGAFIGADLNASGTIGTVLSIAAIMAATLAVPQVLERYAFASGRTGAGNMIVGSAVRTTMVMPQQIGRGVSNVIGSVGKTASK